MNDLTCLLPLAIQDGRLAFEFDPAFYRATQPDLVALDDEALAAHYSNHGRGEGRCASPAAYRRGFLAQIDVTRPTLEIGPAVRPSLVGDRVRYFEISDRDGLIARAIKEGYSYDKCPSVIDYVSPTGDINVVRDKFDSVFSSHCIEHQPDLVTHLKNVRSILTDDGRYFLLIPDKRYCFDNLLPESSVESIRAAHSELRTIHTFVSVLEHYALTTHNDTQRHWLGDHVDTTLVGQQAHRVAVARSVYAAANGGYVDVHAWQFTPESFRSIISELSDIVPFDVERVYGTVRYSNEFGAVLKAK